MKSLLSKAGSLGIRKMVTRPLTSIILAPIVLVSIGANRSPIFAQTEPSGQASLPAVASVPQLVRFNGVLLDEAGSPIATPIAVTFAIYAHPSGDELPALWQETQTITPSSRGSYTVLLGLASPDGIPAQVFKSGQLQYLSVKAEGAPEQPRVLLVSVPYAIKAGDAATLGGLPASAYALNGGRSEAEAIASPAAAPPATNVTTTGAVIGYLPVFNGASTVVDSAIFQSGADIGIGTATPTATLDVSGTTILNGATTINGATTLAGAVSLPATGTATASAGFNSEELKIYTSAYNSTTKAVVDPRFYWEAEVAGNGTATPTATLNLLSSTTTAGTTETGFHFNANGTLNFTAAQTFPANSTAFPSNNVGSSFFGGAGNSSSTGTGNTGSGDDALFSNTTGVANTASGVEALAANTTGSRNTASGYAALIFNTTGSNNTAIGNSAGTTVNQSVGTGSNNTALGFSSAFANGSLTNATAIGADAEVDNSNALILGCVAGKNGCPSAVSVGIGTTTPGYGLEVYSPSAADAELAMVSNGTDAAISVNNTANGGREYWIDSGSKGAGVGEGNFAIYDKTANATRMVVDSSGNVIIGATAQSTNNIVGGQLEVFSESGFNDGIQATGIYSGDFGGTTGVVGFGAISDGSSGGEAGIGAVFLGGNADTAADAGYGIYAQGGFGAKTGVQYSALFVNDIEVNGNVISGDAVRQVDHPIDPANKYLNHAAVQSSEMMNIYSGNVVTDELGLATIKLPDWFEAENGDFRYQLTVIGRKAQAWIAAEVSGGQFKIASDATNTKVSWQITAVREDTYAKAHPLVVEEAKPAREVGFYRHPELFGQPAEKQTEWGRNPKSMQRMQDQRNAMKTHQAKGKQVATATIPAIKAN